MSQPPAPVICIDGPTASGKGTLSALLAKELGFHLLDSGALYRITALAAQQNDLAISVSNEQAIAELIKTLVIKFVDDKVFLNNVDVTSAIRTEEVGMNASTVSSFPRVRQALVDLQLSFQRHPGLIADGRDMGTVIFPQAVLKVFLTAGAEQRARRRFDQLAAKGVSADMAVLLATLQARDAQDSNRSVAPLKPAEDAILLDNSDLSIDQSVKLVMDCWHEMAAQMDGSHVVAEDQKFLQRELVDDPGKTTLLYHATQLDALAGIAAEGLRSLSYWTDDEDVLAYYKETIVDENAKPVVLVIDLDQLLRLVGEHAIEPDHPGIEEPITCSLGKSESKVEIEWFASAQGWRDSLKVVRSLRCRSSIPEQALRVLDEQSDELMSIDEYFECLANRRVEYQSV